MELLFATFKTSKNTKKENGNNFSITQKTVCIICCRSKSDISINRCIFQSERVSCPTSRGSLVSQDKKNNGLCNICYKVFKALVPK